LLGLMIPFFVVAVADRTVPTGPALAHSRLLTESVAVADRTVPTGLALAHSRSLTESVAVDDRTVSEGTGIGRLLEESVAVDDGIVGVGTGASRSLTESVAVSDGTTIIQPLTELQVVPVLTSMKETYLVSEDAELELEFYNEEDVLMNELTELDNAMQVLTVNVNQTLQETMIGLDSTVNQTSSNPVLNFINILFSIPQAEAADLDDEDASKIEIENTKDEIKKLKEQIKAIKEDPNLTKEETKVWPFTVSVVLSL